MIPVVFRDPTFGQNSYLVRFQNDVAVIDPGFNGEAISAYLAEKGYALRMVLLTHGHYDHIRDLRVLQKIHAFVLYVHPGDRAFLDDDALNGAGFFRGSFRLRADQRVELVDDGALVPFGLSAFRVIHTPGHTPGGVCYLYKDVLFAGDTLFKGDLGRTDLAGGSARAMSDSVKKLFGTLSDTVAVFPGHEEETSIGAERRSNSDVVRILRNRS